MATDSAAYVPPTAAIAEMYARATLDLIIHLALGVSNDFVQRPRHYRQVPEDVANILSELRTSMGSTPNLPDGRDRAAIYGALLGRAEFKGASTALREAATSFSNEPSDKGEQLLRLSFLDRVIALRAYLKTLDGQTLSIGEKRTGMVFRHATTVLQSPDVARVFGLPPAPGGAWPLGGVLDGDAAYLVAEITRTLMPRLLIPVTMKPLKFITLQQVAHYGALTLSGVLDDSRGWDSPDRIDAMIRNAFSWAKAGEAFRVDTIRAWKDPAYRLGLSEAERALLPDHPAGEMQAAVGRPSFGGALIPQGPATVTSSPDEICCSAPTLEPGCQTVTEFGKICCSSGQACDSTPVTFTCLPCEFY